MNSGLSVFHWSHTQQLHTTQRPLFNTI